MGDYISLGNALSVAEACRVLCAPRLGRRAPGLHWLLGRLDCTFQDNGEHGIE